MYDQCRMCGLEKSFVDLQDLQEYDFNIYVLLQQYCNINLNNSKLLPQNSCLDCVTLFKSHIDFCEKIKIVQSSLEDKLIKNCIQENSDIKNCLIILEKSDELVIDDVIKVETDFGETSTLLEADYSSDYSLYDPSLDPDVNPKKLKSLKRIAEDEEMLEDDEDYEAPKKKKSRKKVKRTRPKIQKDAEELDHNDESYKSSSKLKPKLPRKGKILFESADTVEKLFQEEIDGMSQISQIPSLNICDKDKNPDGTITEDGLNKLPAIIWRDFPLFCEKCHIEYTSIFDYRNHFESKHPNDDIFSCLNCTNQKFQQVSGFVNHVVTKHHEHLRLCCIFCSEFFWNMSAMYQHCKSNHPAGYKKIFPCFCCGIYADTLMDLKDHKSTHLKKELAESFCTYKDIFYEELNGPLTESKYNLEIAEEFKQPDGSVSEDFPEKMETWKEFDSVCYECLAEFGSPFELMMHYRCNHPELKQKFSCKSCQSKPFLTMRSVIHHGIKHHSKSLSYCCIVCSKQHWNYAGLYQHYRNVHSTFRTCLCLACGLHFDDYVRLRFHATSHKLVPSSEKGKDSIIHCHKCTTVFENRDLYNKHACRIKAKAEKAAAKPEKLYMCEVCGKNYSSSTALANHVATHDDKKEYFYCDLCGQKFSCKYRLKYHRRIHDSNQKMYECEICHVKLKYKHTLTRHYNTHSGERPHACTFCDKKFAAKGDMIIHQRLHTGDFPYECSVCNDRYPSWSNLFKHAKSRHKIDIRSDGIKNIRKVRERMEMEQFSAETSQDISSSYN